MKKLFFILVLAIGFAACNNGEPHEDPSLNKNCDTTYKARLTKDQKDTLLVHNWDSTKPFTFTDTTGCHVIMP